MLGKTLFLDEGAEKYFYVPQGVAPRKNEKARRMARQYFVSRQVLVQGVVVGVLLIHEDRFPGPHGIPEVIHPAG